MLRRYRPFAALAVTGCLVAGGAALAATGATDPTTDASLQYASVTTTAVAQVQATISDNFSIFRDRPASGMPDDVAAMVASPTRFGRNPALARAIKTPTGQGWVIPGDGYLCVAMPDPVDGYGTSCGPTALVLKQGLYITLHGNLPGGQAAEVLLVPDGAQAATYDDAGNAAPVPVDDGVATALSPRPGSLRVKW